MNSVVTKRPLTEEPVDQSNCTPSKRPCTSRSPENKSNANIKSQEDYRTKLHQQIAQAIVTMPFSLIGIIVYEFVSEFRQCVDCQRYLPDDQMNDDPELSQFCQRCGVDCDACDQIVPERLTRSCRRCDHVVCKPNVVDSLFIPNPAIAFCPSFYWACDICSKLGLVCRADGCNFCNNGYNQCYVCGDHFCDEHLEKQCKNCGKKCCSRCIFNPCSSCDEKDECQECTDTFDREKCDFCEREFCRDCERREMKRCALSEVKRCNVQFCNGCVDKVANCDECGDLICNAHMDECYGCADVVCSDGVVCSSHRTWNQCKGCSDEPFCPKCLKPCPICDTPTCWDCRKTICGYCDNPCCPLCIRQCIDCHSLFAVDCLEQLECLERTCSECKKPMFVDDLEDVDEENEYRECLCNRCADQRTHPLVCRKCE